MAVQDDIERLINMKSWAVVGASNNPDKYGFKIFVSLRDSGYDVVPINPTAADIDGTKAYPSLADLPSVPDVVDVVVPPKLGVKVVEEAFAKGVKNIWFQPGAESAEAVELAAAKGMTVISNACAMVMRKHWR